NTCYRIVERAMEALGARGRVVIEIEKRLPVQGGLGGASGNAVAALLGLEIALKKRLSLADELRIAGEVGSDLPLFLIGGTVLGTGRGEEVYPLPDLPAVHCVVALPKISVSTPQAFADWDLGMSGGDARPSVETAELTGSDPSDRMNEFSRRISAWLSSASGVPVGKGRVRAETPLLDLVRTGIGNDFEKVVFPKYPELREVKSVLERAGAFYASLSGSGSAVYGLFESKKKAETGAAALTKIGTPATVTSTLARPQYWKKMSD
ncbi:MAG: 4-(cytidine 5'-diphospho)-2-C-methyl-D-erythritol kinase, partial [Terriglobales bacterium]